MYQVEMIGPKGSTVVNRVEATSNSEAERISWAAVYEAVGAPEAALWAVVSIKREAGQW